MCDLKAIGVSSIIKTIRSVGDLSRMLPTLDLTCEDVFISGFVVYYESRKRELKIRLLLSFLYYESRNRELKTRPIYECRCDERRKTKSEKPTHLTYTGFLGKPEHLKIETRLIDDMFPSVMGEYVFLK